MYYDSNFNITYILYENFITVVKNFKTLFKILFRQQLNFKILKLIKFESFKVKIVFVDHALKKP